MKQQIISLLERAKENDATIGDVLAEVRGMCQDCTQPAESKLEWITTPDIRDVPDCVLTPSGIALKQSQTSAQDERTQVDNDLVSSLLQMASVAPASECEILQAAAAALASDPVAGEAVATVRGSAGESWKGDAIIDLRPGLALAAGTELFLAHAAPQASPAADGRDAKDETRKTAGNIQEPMNGDGWHVVWWNESMRLMLPDGSRLDRFQSYRNGTMQLTIKTDAAIASQQGEGR